MPRLKKAPPHDEVASASGELLSAAGVAENVDRTKVLAVSGTRRPAYHLLLTESCTKPASEILTDVLTRSFPRDHSGWLIDLREARAIIEAAHRLSKSRSRTSSRLTRIRFKRNGTQITGCAFGKQVRLISD